MKKIILIFFLFIGGITLCNAQSNLVVGSKFVNLKYGFSKHSFPTFGEIQMGYMFHEKFYFRGGFAFEHGNVGSTLFNIPYMTADFGWNFLNIKNYVFFNVNIGPHMGLEYIHSDRVGSQKDRTFIYGGRVSAELDVYLTSFMSFKYEFAHFYSRRSKLGNWYYTNTIGLSISF